jgi:hypothetical protein
MPLLEGTSMLWKKKTVKRRKKVARSQDKECSSEFQYQARNFIRFWASGIIAGARPICFYQPFISIGKSIKIGLYQPVHVNIQACCVLLLVNVNYSF